MARVRSLLSCIDWSEQRHSEPEGTAFPQLGHGAYEPSQHRDLLGADAEAQACTSPASGPLHIILCPLQINSFSRQIQQRLLKRRPYFAWMARIHMAGHEAQQCSTEMQLPTDAHDIAARVITNRVT